ncbi:MAG: lysophospholipid acyltransferase family protein [Oligoflexales bacterium]
MGRLPRILVPGVIGIIQTLGVVFFRSERRRIYKNLFFIKGLPAHSSFAKLFADQVIRHQTASTLEMLAYQAGRDFITFEGEDGFREILHRFRADGKGAMVVTAHLGSWELLGAMCAKHFPGGFHALAKPSRNEIGNFYIEKIRANLGVRVLWSNRKSILRDMLGVLRGNDFLGFVMDQKPEGRKGPVVDFMGKPTEFVSGPARLAIQTNCGVVAAFCVRIAPWRYRIISKVLLEPNHSFGDEQELTQVMADEIGAQVGTYPEQWLWGYRRWRT